MRAWLVLGLGVGALTLGGAGAWLLEARAQADATARAERQEQLAQEQRRAEALAAADEADAERAFYLPGVPIARGITIDTPAVLEGVSVFPVYAAAAEEASPPVRSLQAALRQENGAIQETTEVQSLTFVSTTEQPALLGLSGSLLHGGFQDRMIHHDVVLRSDAPVEVRCAEHDRWTGHSHRGDFQIQEALAESGLRTIAQADDDSQQAVWDRVHQVNASYCKRSPTSALNASLSDPTLAKQRDELADAIDAHLASRPLESHLVGLGYAVNGHPRSFHAFGTHELFEQFRQQLIKTATLEALSERQDAGVGDDEVTGEMQMALFVQRIQAGDVALQDQLDGDGVGTRVARFRHQVGVGQTTLWVDAEGERPVVVSFSAMPSQATVERRCSG